MTDRHDSPGTRDRQLLGVIRTQTEIAKLGVDLAGVMSVVAARAQELTAAAGAVVELAEGEDMVYRASSGITESFLGLRLKRSGSLSGHCVAIDQPLRCDDSEADPRVDRLACRQVGIRSMICAPLRHQDTVVGVLKVMAEAPNRFTDREVETLSLMSELIAAAMFHAARSETSELFHRATHDPLTGIANRALFYDRLRTSLSLASRHDERLGVLQIDMDDLKPLNDRHGHQAGDHALIELATRLTRAARASDTVARLGGDEFGMVLPRLGSRDEARWVTQRMAECFGPPFRFADQELPISASFGLAIYPDDGDTPERLVERADHEMYSNKRERKAARTAPAADRLDESRD